MAPAARTAALTMALLGLALVPAAARGAHQTAWQDAAPGVPSTVDLNDVAVQAQIGSVVAVGRDTSTGTAAVFHHSDQGWIQDTVPDLPAGASDSRLTAVAIGSTPGNNVAWAVGTYRDAANAIQPLVLRAAGGEWFGFDDPGNWVAPETGLPAGVEPTAIAFHETDGLLGTAGGRVHEVNGPNPGHVGNAVPLPPGGTPGAIRGIGMYGDGLGYTAGDLPAGGTDRIFNVDLEAIGGPRMLPVASGPDSLHLGMVGIDAAAADDAVAIEGPDPTETNAPAHWSPTGALWSRDPDDAFTAASSPADLSTRGSGGDMVQAVAGGHAGDGAVWRRTGSGDWTRDSSVSPDPLNGVGVIEAADIWAVGDGGTVRHYGALPHPGAPTATIDSGPVGETTETAATFGFSSSEAGATFQCSLDGAAFAGCTSPKTYAGLALGQHTFRVRAVGVGGEGVPASRIFTVVAPAQIPPPGGSGLPVVQTPPAPNCKQAPHPLLRNVLVRKRAGMLLIEFDAAAAVRVKAKAFHGTRLIGRTKERVLDQGHHQIKLRYGVKKGKPTRLKMLARPAAKGACT